LISLIAPRSLHLLCQFNSDITHECDTSASPLRLARAAISFAAKLARRAHNSISYAK